MILRNKLEHSIEYVADMLRKDFNAVIYDHGLSHRVYTIQNDEDKIEFFISKTESAFTIVWGIGEVELQINISDGFAEDELKHYLSRLEINNILTYGR